MTRGLTPRDEYEKVSREIRSTTTRGDQVHNNKTTSGRQQQEEIRSTTTNIRVTYSSYRFDAYKDEMRACGASAVIFGHQLGDLHENVISNVMKVRSKLPPTRPPIPLPF